MESKKGGTYSDDDAAAFVHQLLNDTEQHGVIFMDVDGTIRGWNHGAGFITSFAPADVIGKHAGILFTPEDRERKIDAHELDTALVVGAAPDERWHMRKNGSTFWSSGVTLPLKDSGGQVRGFLKIFRDMTHLRTRIKFLENSVQEQKVREDHHDIFLGTIAHELRNPLAPLKAAMRMIEQSVTVDGRVEQAIKIIDRQMATLERLVEDIVDLTRVKTGKLNIQYERAQLQTIVNSSVDSCRAAAAVKHIELHISVPSVPIELELDGERLHQVVVNLLNNAIKYTPSGGQIWITATTDQTHAMFVVKDNGAGIAPELLPKIFDMFTQAPDADAHRGAGLGIGLALVKQVVELHQGTVEVASEGPGKGSRFIVRVPQRRPQGSEAEPMGR